MKFDLAQCLKMGQFCQAAYDLYSTGIAATPAGYVITDVFNRNGKPAAFLAKSPTEGWVLSNKGTTEDCEWVFNLDIEKVDWNGIEVHKGMLDAYLEIRSAILNALKDYNPVRGPTLTITGHSLGAGISVIALRDPVLAMAQAITFATPEVVGASSCWQPYQLMCLNNRYDVVTTCLRMFGYQQVGDFHPVDFHLGNFEANHALSNYLTYLSKDAPFLEKQDGAILDSSRVVSDVLDQCGASVDTVAITSTTKDILNG